MFRTRLARPGACASLAAMLFSLSPCATAQDTLEEIVVTADFRARTPLEMPSSLSLFDSEQVEGLTVQHFEELVFAVPNLNWSGDGHRARYFQIRGVGELEQYEGAPDPSVGFLVDDIDFSGIGTIATLFDVEQIEVLRGPQGSRYGANALAGLVYVHTADPGDEPSGRLQVTGGQDSALAAGVALGGPLPAQGLAYRLSAHRYESDGFRDNPALGRRDTNRRRETSVRGKLLWETGNDWRVRLTGLFADIDNGYDAFAIDNSLTTLSDKPGRDAQQSIGAAVRAVWSGSSRYEFTSITSMADSDIAFGFDADWGSAQSWAPFVYDFVQASDRSRRTLSQEFRVASKLDGRLFGGAAGWLAGVYFLELDEDLETSSRGEYVDPFSGFADSLDERLASRFESRSVAVFGQLDIEVGEAGVFAAGVRLETRSTDYADSNGLALAPGEDMVGGELSYRHGFSDALTGYVALSRGYKAGGFNLGPVPEGGREFGQEALWNLEAGIKALWLDGTLAFNGAVFASRREEQQVRTSVQLNPADPASFVFFTDNAARGRTLGAEAELRWLPSESWQLYASAGLLDAEFADYTSATGDLSGRDQAHAPGYTLAAGAAWRHPSGWFARLDLSARDAFYFDVSHDQRSQAYQLARAKAGYESERWSAGLWVRNLFDEAYAVRGFYFGNEPPDFPDTLYVRQGDPRQLGVTFDMRF